MVHGDGEMRVLLEKLRDCGVQAVEAFTPKPMTHIDVAATRRLPPRSSSRRVPAASAHYQITATFYPAASSAARLRRSVLFR